MKSDFLNFIVCKVANKRQTRIIQSMELICFLFSGYFLKNDLFVSGLLLLTGIFLAIIAGESAIAEYELNKEARKDLNNGTI